MDIESGYEELGTLTWNASNSQMSLSASNPGLIKINGRIKYSDGTQAHVGCYEYMIVPQEGTYYIQNASTRKYVDIEGPSRNTGAVIQQWQYHTADQEKWNVEHVSGSGGQDATNLVNATHNRGSSIVIGFEESVWSDEVNDWCDVFFQTLASGATVQNACYAADDYIAEEWYDENKPERDITTDSWYIAGNSNTAFK